MKERLRERIFEALKSCYDNGVLTSRVFPDIQLEVPVNTSHGDFASNLAMILARHEKKSPHIIAKTLIEMLSKGDFVDKVEIAGPGFINFFINRTSWYSVLDHITHQEARFGSSNIGEGRKVQVEFVSANPTGPLHVGHGRGAAVGDAVASILQFAGFKVQREYYVNDAGNQVATLGKSIWSRLQELQGKKTEFPEDGYQGEYIINLAANLLNEMDDINHVEEIEAQELCAAYGVKKILQWISDDLEAFGVVFDNWFSEQSLYDLNMVDLELSKLAAQGLSYEKDSALWLRTTDYGDDKDRVLIKSDKSPTYFASDVAYHMEKFDRGFDRVIDVWGADHHGYVPRMKAVIKGLGHETDALQVLLIQMVNLLRDGRPVSMGKRSGNFITLREVVEEVGKDACRFFFLMRRSDSQLDFDLELAKKQSNDNPVYYVQYAHARVCSINRAALEAGVPFPSRGDVDLSLLTLEEELLMIKKMAQFQQVVEGAAENCEPHRIVYYLQDLAAQFHSYYNLHRVLVDDPAITSSRLYLVNAVKTVISNALNLLGVTAPESM